MSGIVEKRKKWDFWDALIILVLVLLARELVILLAYRIDPGANEIGVFSASVVVMALILFLLHFYYIEHKYMGTGRLEFRTDKLLWYIQTGILTGAIAFGLFTLLYGFVIESLGITTAGRYQDLLVQAEGLPERILLAVSLVIFVPVVQETLFRGFFYEALKKHLDIGGALMLTSFVFALSLAEFSLIPAYLLAGLLLGFVYELTGSLYTPVTAVVVWHTIMLAYHWLW